MRILLVDADIVAFAAATRAETKIEWSPGSLTYVGDVQKGRDSADAFINQLIEDTEADEAVLFFSHVDNFRKKLNPDYKSNRVGTYKPLCLDPTRKHLESTWRAKVMDNIEADDALGIFGTMDSIHEYVIASTDKDMLTLPGAHLYNWNKPELGIREISPESADRSFYIQAVAGDSTDGYGGCPGLGPKRAADLVDKHWPNPWPAIVEAYAKKDLDEDYALMMARMARILRSGEYDDSTAQPLLWEPPTNG